MNLIKAYRQATQKLETLKGLPALLFRLVLAYGFYMPTMMKWGDIGAISGWFESMDILYLHSTPTLLQAPKWL